MVRGFVDMSAPAAKAAEGPPVRLQSGAALRMDSVMAMRMAWRALADRSELPTTQFEWVVAAMNQIGPSLQAHVGYVTDGASMRAILPLLVTRRMGVEHLQFVSPGIPMPVDIPHTDPVSLEQLLRSVIRLGRPIVLPNLLSDSPAADVIRSLARRAMVQIEKTEPVTYLPIANYQLQDKFQSAARVSILATSYGLSGGPNDVIFQCVSPSLEQVTQLFHESMQLQTTSSSPEPADRRARRKPAQELDSFEFLRTYAFQSAQRGEVRFSCLRIGGRLLAVQMFIVRKQTAWLLTAAHLERFRGTTLDTLLMGETIRKMQVDKIQQVVAPSSAGVREVGQCMEMPCINVKIYPWSSRSLMAMTMGGAANAARRLVRRRNAHAATGDAA